MTYTATKFNTAKDKEHFEKRFKSFVSKGFPVTLFTKEFYTRMSMMRGHIAHYNQGGFYDAQFEDHAARARFLHHWETAAIYGNPAFTWSDVERVLAEWLRNNPEHFEREMTAAHNAVETSERAELERLQRKYG